MRYPVARRADVADEMFGHRVADPYRWLEDPSAQETKEWLAAQDELARGHLDALPGRDRLRARLAELIDTGLVSVPVWRGERCFFVRRAPQQEHPVLVCRDGGNERVLIDPAAIDSSGLTTLDDWQPDVEGRLLAYQLSHGGDEESSLLVMDITTGENVDTEHLAADGILGAQQPADVAADQLGQGAGVLLIL